ncbi:chemotaxis protein CheY [Clostridium acetireducens DSM 10703]|uniref:Stage 0 sporulation protein A homolog n=1 Tax=Clostridium acetireducens DSM 10703 TaxID=1121290 RepID=A0A1E8EY54_9CLOT|nr:response regulator [Clostridium acetireducens]OFI05868.1 chemotaxis protein CheY [Clostridium acetireducens DSM 10703]
MANILVVDDSAIMRVNLRSVLTRGGHTVIAEAEDAQQAYLEYKKCHPDLVTMDVNMPGMSGIEVTRKILKEYPKANVIIVSSLEQRDLVIDALEAGAKHYILKPITSEKLLERIDAVLKNKYECEKAPTIEEKIKEMKEQKKYFSIKNEKGVFVVKINEDIDLKGLELLDTAISGLLFVEPLDIVFDFDEIETIGMDIYQGIVEQTKKLFEAKAAVKVIVKNKVLAKFVKNNTINAYAKVYIETPNENKDIQSKQTDMSNSKKQLEEGENESSK